MFMIFADKDTLILKRVENPTKPIWKNYLKEAGNWPKKED